MANDLVKANYFELQGEASITYDFRTSLMTYNGPSRPPLRDHFEFSETSPALVTPIGPLVTGTISFVADGDTDTITVLLPDVNLRRRPDGGAEETAFETVAVWTTNRSSFGGPGLVEGPVQDYVHATLTGRARLVEGPCVLSARLVRELPGPGRLRVEGVCTFGRTGYTVELVRHEPQGSVPDDLLLDLKVEAPDFGGDVITAYPVSYEEETEIAYRTVTVLPDGPQIEVEIIT